MKAVGRITHVAANGRKTVTVHVPIDDDKSGSFRIKYAPVDYILSNANDIPKDHPEYGLFEFCVADQFCKWIDPNKS